MYRVLNYEEVRDGYLLIDVRSPGEFREYTIPGAVNVPLFSNEERAEIGTVYKQKSVEEAVELGMEYASKNLPRIYREIADLRKKHRDLVAFCERGGMRSSSVCGLLNAIGIKLAKLDGGYKKYRKYINEQLPQLMESVDLIVLHGMTGTGKTEVLKALEAEGENVLDLEAFANHRGSLLGSVGLGTQNSQRTFESLLYEKLMERGAGTYFAEAESSRIGNVIQPKYLFDKLKKGQAVLIEGSIEKRVERLVEEYTREPNHLEEILSAVDLMEKYTGKARAEEFREMANGGRFHELSEVMMLKYYDPMYGHGQSKHEFIKVLSSDNLDDCVNELRQLLKK